MSDQTKFGKYLLVPPLILWAALLLFWVDASLGHFVFARLDAQRVMMIVFITGLVFPAASMAVSVWGLWKKLDQRDNVIVLVVSIVLLVALALDRFVF